MIYNDDCIILLLTFGFIQTILLNFGLFVSLIKVVYLFVLSKNTPNPLFLIKIESVSGDVSKLYFPGLL